MAGMSATVGAVPPGWLVDVVEEHPDFPEPGVLFRDLSPLWRSSSATSRCAMAMAQDMTDVDLVVGIESRGFLVGLPVAQRLGVGFVPMRKPGKLPGELISASYELEYGTDSLELQASAIEAGERVLLIDDVIATGGTLAAAATLVEKAGAELMGIGAVLELSALGGRRKLTEAGVDVSLVRSLWEIS